MFRVCLLPLPGRPSPHIRPGAAPPPPLVPRQAPFLASLREMLKWGHMILPGYIDIRAADLRLDVLRAVQGEAVTLEVGEGHVGHVGASQHVSRLHRAMAAGQTLSPGTQRSCQTLNNHLRHCLTLSSPPCPA